MDFVRRLRKEQTKKQEPRNIQTEKKSAIYNKDVQVSSGKRVRGRTKDKAGGEKKRSHFLDKKTFVVLSKKKKCGGTGSSAP